MSVSFESLATTVDYLEHVLNALKDGRYSGAAGTCHLVCREKEFAGWATKEPTGVSVLTVYLVRAKKPTVYLVRAKKPDERGTGCSKS